jgi:DNA-binding NtrC family response regulator
MGTNRPLIPDSDQTETGSDETNLRKTSAPQGLGAVIRFIYDDTVLKYHVGKADRVVIGRGEEADVRVTFHDISRRHAMVRLTPSLAICDLGSTNGTTLAGSRLQPSVWAPIEPGTAFHIANVVVVIQGVSAGDPRRVLGAVELQRALREQLTTFAADGKPFAVATIRCESQRKWTDAVAGFLAPRDTIAFFDESNVTLLLVNRTAEQCEHLVSEVNSHLQILGGAPFVHTRACPRDGSTLEALMPEAAAEVQRHETIRPGGPGQGPVIRGEKMARIYGVLDEIAPSKTSILMLGETGAGKEVLARYIHSKSGRPEAPFVALNCAALPENLLESELFGYEKGAFTGAVSAKPGLLEAAENGTVFLDEAGEMPLSTQAKLLRVLEERTVLRLGALKPRPINARLLAATNRNLQAEIAAGRFRADLYYRLNGVSVVIPPLRKRRDEIIPLAMHFAAAAAAQLRKPVPFFAADVLTRLVDYPWPGNVRELKSVVERAVLFCRGGSILTEHLPEEVAVVPVDPDAVEPTPQTVRMTNPEIPAVPKAPSLPVFEPPTGTRHSPLPPSGVNSLRGELDALEKERVLAALEQANWNQTRAAELLGMTRRALIGRLERYNHPRPPRRDK